MSDLQAIADRVEIEALRGEFTDAVMMRDYDRLASLFTPDGAVRIPYINAEAVSREELRAGIERLQALLDYFVQTAHPGTIQLDGDTATGRAYISELARFRDGRSELNYAVYHDATSAPRTAGSSPSASTRSDTSTPRRWRARRPTQRDAPANPPAENRSSAKGRRWPWLYRFPRHRRQLPRPASAKPQTSGSSRCETVKCSAEPLIFPSKEVSRYGHVA